MSTTKPVLQGSSERAINRNSGFVFTQSLIKLDPKSESAQAVSHGVCSFVNIQAELSLTLVNILLKERIIQVPSLFYTEPLFLIKAHSSSELKGI